MEELISEAGNRPVLLASFGVRALARLADMAVLSLVEILLTFVYAGLGAEGFSARGLLVGISLFFLLCCIAYFSFGTSGGRQTVGQRLAGLQVVRVGDTEAIVGPVRSLGRSLIDLLCWWLISYGIGILDYLPIAVTPSKRALHDLATGICVIQKRRPRYVSLGIWTVGMSAAFLGSLFLIVRPFLLQAFYAPSLSMAPALSSSSHFVIDKAAYWGHNPSRGDIVVFDAPAEAASDFPYGAHTQFVKRVIGLPGDELRLASGHVYRYGQPGPLWEPYVHYPYAGNLPEPEGSDQDDWFERRRSSLTRHDGKWWIRVPPGKYFVLGDNRSDSNDSHLWGFLPRQDIRGKAILLFKPRLEDL
jgi:signal peptidase I